MMQQLRNAFIPTPAQSATAAAGEKEEGMEVEAAAEATCEEGFEHASGAISGKVHEVTEALVKEMTDAKGKLKKEVTERKRLHNLVQELRGNIRVFCRVRPLSKKNLADGAKAAVCFPSDVDISLDVAGKMAAFQFDRVFDPSSTQEQVFEETQPLVVSVLDGYNVCIFAYGQTGSGKTHTMQGYGAEAGVTARPLLLLFLVCLEFSSPFSSVSNTPLPLHPSLILPSRRCQHACA